MRRVQRNAVAVRVGLVALAPLPAMPGSGAVFSAVAAGTAAFATDTLNPPTSLTGTAPLGLSANLSWTATVDLYAAGYRVYRRPTSGSTFTLVATVTPRTTTTASNTPLLAGSYTFVVRSFAGSWMSVASNSVTLTLL